MVCHPVLHAVYLNLILRFRSGRLRDLNLGVRLLPMAFVMLPLSEQTHPFLLMFEQILPFHAKLRVWSDWTSERFHLLFDYID